MPSARTLAATLEALLKDAPALERPDVAHAIETDDEEDPRFLGFWLVAMAEETRRVASMSLEAGGEPSSSLERQLDEALSRRPAPDSAHGQLYIDPASVARRATVVAAHCARNPGPVVAVGDDDGVSVALALMGLPEVHAFDIDQRVLDFLGESAAARGVVVHTHLADVFEDVVPSALRHRAAAVITDPFRSARDAAPFIAFGLSMMRREPPGWFFLCDHADWSFDHEATRAMLDSAGLTEVAHERALHRYPLSRASFPELLETACAIGVSASWIEALLDATSAWSDLFVWTRVPR